MSFFFLFFFLFQLGGRFYVDTTLQNNAARHLLFSLLSHSPFD